MIASRNIGRCPDTTENFAELAAHQIRILWEQRFGSRFSDAELEDLTTAIWECVWEKGR